MKKIKNSTGLKIDGEKNSEHMKQDAGQTKQTKQNYGQVILPPIYGSRKGGKEINQIHNEESNLEVNQSPRFPI
ncbi:hypothetical protein FGO68_gene1425 [Halteria grandinella]|uniref:Uncharacterized protein n=1 Tax=Halteria grandinella TaxID=5974 RepID=A0A8J8NZ58_HALGN|nr:hypothetical protein FGO68_gene1425 [Halteria grandinella]